MKRMFLFAGLTLALLCGMQSTSRAENPGYAPFGTLGGMALNHRFINLGIPFIMPSHQGHDKLYDWTPYIMGQYGYSPYQPYVASAFYTPGSYTWAYPVYPTWHGGYPASRKVAAKLYYPDGTPVPFQE
ncbi:hypothetical protein [Tuwongella immobilis]|uniref:Uncharacterized protein n=1 Tax=Tuwongella immobilis TaxID=692036 RepID=A0A6C2YIV8_9BACT|nr:hypothetical protein [Tuwongella immobilis]VIP00912.1 unnamed protein product [Tuwongella immobilis]VTR97242.1 unnamed protein product [Tuwongella immobilis]